MAYIEHDVLPLVFWMDRKPGQGFMERRAHRRALMRLAHETTKANGPVAPSVEQFMCELALTIEEFTLVE